VLEVTQVEIEIELVVERAERGDVGLDGHVGIQRGLRERVIARTRQPGVARVGFVAAELLREQVADLEMLGFFRGPE